MTISEEKQRLRKEIAWQKKQYPAETLAYWSEQNALPGEVQTADFLNRWYQKKQIALPVMQGNDLQLLPYQGKEAVRRGPFGIWEPAFSPESTSIEKEIDLIIVPGVAFDRQLNRLGRGKGYYDRLLTTLQVPKIGIAYSFQLREQIPVEAFDRKMDLLITEKEIIG